MLQSVIAAAIRRARMDKMVWYVVVREERYTMTLAPLADERIAYEAHPND